MSDDIRWESRGLTLKDSFSWLGFPRWASGDYSVVQLSESEWVARVSHDSGSCEGRGASAAAAQAACDREAERIARVLVAEWAPWLRVEAP